MSFEIIFTAYFERELKRLAKRHRSMREDLRQLLADLQQNPRSGSPLGRDCYKVRMAIATKGHGKSSGARVITCVKFVGQRIYLLSIYDKSDQETLSEKQRDELLTGAGLL